MNSKIIVSILTAAAAMVGTVVDIIGDNFDNWQKWKSFTGRWENEKW